MALTLDDARVIIEQDEARVQPANSDSSRKRAAPDQIGTDVKRVRSGRSSSKIPDFSECYTVPSQGRRKRLITSEINLEFSAIEVRSLEHGQHILSGFYEGFQTICGETSRVLTRKYKNKKSAHSYYKFLKAHKHRNIFKPLYKMEDGKEFVIVFSDQVDCSLRGYLCHMAPEQLLTPPDQSYQQAFSNNVASIFRQIVEVCDKFHDRRMSIGNLNMDNIFLDLSEKLPRVQIILPDYEDLVESGEFSTIPYACSEDLISIGGLLHDCASVLGLSWANAAEIMHLCRDLQQGTITCCAEVLRHPGIIFESKKVAFLLDVYEYILKVYEDDFFGPDKIFPDPCKLKESDWRNYFSRVLKKLSIKFRRRYFEGPEQDNFCNFCKFLRNIIIHLGSTKKIMNEFGDGERFLRYARTYYPKLFIDLVYLNIRYSEKQQLLEKLLDG